MHLGRWGHALRGLLDAGEAHFDAALQLAREKVRHCRCIFLRMQCCPATLGNDDAALPMPRRMLQHMRMHCCPCGDHKAVRPPFAQHMLSACACDAAVLPPCALRARDRRPNEALPNALLRAQGLLRELLGALGEADGRRPRVLTAYAEQLAGRSLREDAGVAFLAAEDAAAALQQYSQVGQWRMALALAGGAPFVLLYAQL
jgi:hypothetical protein